MKPTQMMEEMIMTSNQLSYWKLKEEERANRAKEAETNRANVVKEAENYRSNLAKEAETHRANVEAEDIKRLSNALEERGLAIKDKQLLTQLAELYITQGAASWSQLPDELQKQVEDAYHASGLSADSRSATFSDWITGIYKELKDIFKSGGSKIIAALF